MSHCTWVYSTFISNKSRKIFSILEFSKNIYSLFSTLGWENYFLNISFNNIVKQAPRLLVFICNWGIEECRIVDPHMGLVFFICCRSHFLPSGGLLKSQMLLPGWVVSESGSGLEMQWGGDTCWRIFRRAFGLLEWSWVSFEVWGGPPPSLSTMNPGQMGRAAMKLRAWCLLQEACSSRKSGWASHACWPVNRRTGRSKGENIF